MMRTLLLNILLVLSLNGFGANLEGDGTAIVAARPQRLVYTPLFSKVAAVINAFPLGHPKYSPWAEPYVHYPPLFCLQPRAHIPAGTQHHFWFGTFHAASLRHILEPVVVGKLMKSVSAGIFETPLFDGMPVLEGSVEVLEKASSIRRAKEPIDLTQGSNRALLERITAVLIKVTEKDGYSIEGFTVEAFAQADLEAIFNALVINFSLHTLTGILEGRGFLCQQHADALENNLRSKMYQAGKALHGLESQIEREVLINSSEEDRKEDSEEDKFSLEDMADKLENIDREKAKLVSEYAAEILNEAQAAWRDYHAQRFTKHTVPLGLLDQRNALWLKRIQQYIGTKPAPWLGAVGYEHIPGMLSGLLPNYTIYRFNAAAHTWHPVTAATEWAVK